MGAARLDVMQRVGKGGGLLRKKGGQQRRNRAGVFDSLGGRSREGGIAGEEEWSSEKKRSASRYGFLCFISFISSLPVLCSSFAASG
ncbi:hypothetical protein CK203_040946 [Vitis vinifera]|uniref:Uncharacterized protein n=1 Tax=Vitis vinifera TaxID=29760 RepID=A0A438HV90_VITVI|nr:hypothetical protein CK203_040946 [Vitis vinifera]